MTYSHFHIQEDMRLIPERAMQWRPWKCFKWLEPFVSHIWHWLGEQYVRKEVWYKTVAVDHERLRDLIAETQLNLRLICGDDACRHVIVGPKEFYHLQDEFFKDPVSMHLYVQIGMGRAINVYGMTVHCIPWFEGVLVLPDLMAQAKVPERSW